MKGFIICVASVTVWMLDENLCGLLIIPAKSCNGVFVHSQQVHKRVSVEAMVCSEQLFTTASIISSQRWNLKKQTRSRYASKGFSQGLVDLDSENRSSGVRLKNRLITNAIYQSHASTDKCLPPAGIPVGCCWCALSMIPNEYETVAWHWHDSQVVSWALKLHDN